MANKPQVGSRVKVVDQNSVYRNHAGEVTAVDAGDEQSYQVTLDNHHKALPFRWTQLRVLTSPTAGSGGIVAGNNPSGHVDPATATPTDDERRDYSGSGFNPVAAQGTIGDTRNFQLDASRRPTPGGPMGRNVS